MENLTHLSSVLNELANLQNNLESKGGPPYNTVLYKKISQIQDDILHHFGLPCTPRFEKLILFDKQPSYSEISLRIAALHEAARDYLLSDIKSEYQILREARELKKDPQQVFQELNIKIHIYTLFVYVHILLCGKGSAKEVLKEFKLVNHGECLSTLSRLALGIITPEHRSISSLRENGVKYIEDFHSFICG